MTDVEASKPVTKDNLRSWPELLTAKDRLHVTIPLKDQVSPLLINAQTIVDLCATDGTCLAHDVAIEAIVCGDEQTPVCYAVVLADKQLALDVNRIVKIQLLVKRSP